MAGMSLKRAGSGEGTLSVFRLRGARARRVKEQEKEAEYGLF